MELYPAEFILIPKPHPAQAPPRNLQVFLNAELETLPPLIVPQFHTELPLSLWPKYLWGSNKVYSLVSYCWLAMVPNNLHWQQGVDITWGYQWEKNRLGLDSNYWGTESTHEPYVKKSQLHLFSHCSKVRFNSRIIRKEPLFEDSVPSLPTPSEKAPTASC